MKREIRVSSPNLQTWDIKVEMADFAKMLLKANFPHDIMAKKTEYVSYIFIHNMPSFGMSVDNVSLMR